MKANHWALALSLSVVTLAGAAKADTGYYATANIAQASCGTDAVVWVDLDRGRYYQIGQGDSMKSGTGIGRRAENLKNYKSRGLSQQGRASHKAARPCHFQHH